MLRSRCSPKLYLVGPALELSSARPNFMGCLGGDRNDSWLGAMTIVAVLFLLDKYRLLKKTSFIAAIAALVAGLGYAGVVG
jgi:hypothetical protein